jgi:hypothetical protein
MFSELDYTEPAHRARHTEAAVLRGIASVVFGLLVPRPAYPTGCPS